MAEFPLWIIGRNLLLAARWSVLLTGVAFLGGAFLGLLVTTARISSGWVWRVPAIAFIECLLGTPLLMQLFLCFFGLPFLGLNLSSFGAATLVLGLYTAAHLAEIWRGSVQALPRGQWEASASLGFSFLQQMRYVVLPQALRHSVPASTGFLVQLVKSTALASSIGLVEITQAGSMMNNTTFQPFLIYGLVAALYFALCYPLSRYSRKLERRFHGTR